MSSRQIKNCKDHIGNKFTLVCFNVSSLVRLHPYLIPCLSCILVILLNKFNSIQFNTKLSHQEDIKGWVLSKLTVVCILLEEGTADALNVCSPVSIQQIDENIVWD